jgi:uncharacterized protein (TIGR00251 family)
LAVFKPEADEQPTADHWQLRMTDFKIERENVLFWLKVKPRASHERLGLDSADDLVLELKAPPVEGQANEACVRFFARALRIPQACVVILSGKSARRKLLRVTGHSAEETVAKLKTLVGRGRGRGTS